MSRLNVTVRGAGCCAWPVVREHAATAAAIATTASAVFTPLLRTQNHCKRRGQTHRNGVNGRRTNETGALPKERARVSTGALNQKSSVKFRRTNRGVATEVGARKLLAAGPPSVPYAEPYTVP